MPSGPVPSQSPHLVAVPPCAVAVAVYRVAMYPMVNPAMAVPSPMPTMVTSVEMVATLVVVLVPVVPLVVMVMPMVPVVAFAVVVAVPVMVPPTPNHRAPTVSPG